MRASNGPDMIEEESIRPMPLLLQNDPRWANAKLLGPQQVVGGSRYQENRSYSPDEGLGLVRRQKETLYCIAQPGLAARVYHVTLMNDGKNRPRNEIPVRRERNGDNGLEIEGITESIFIWAQPKIKIALKRDAYQRGDWIR